ncbi:MAG: OmpH family outer membrane protein [Phycisphaerae bacterium]|nr:OmpH family outer membrane protein [Phycisphaerae bacterium]
MDNRKTTWPLILGAILTATLCSGFIFDWGKKKAKDPNEAKNAAAAQAIQEEKLTAQDEKIAELNRKIDEQSKLLAAQEEKYAELEKKIKRFDEIEASVKNRNADINDSDMSAIREMIEKQVKLNVKKADMPAMGVVSIRKIFRDCKRTALYRQETNAERQKIGAELSKLDSEIKAQQAGLKTLKNGSENYMAQVKEILEKQARLQAQQEFHKQQLALKEQQLTENIYGDILRITSYIAKEKGLDLVFEASEPELPASSPTELELSMGTHKLLFGGGCVDITEEVIGRLDTGL